MISKVHASGAGRLLALGLLLVLAGCDQAKKPGEAPPPKFAPPALWRVSVVEDSGGQKGVIDICANPEVVSSFTRVEPQVNGQPCLPYGKPAADTGAERIMRCQAGDLRYGLYVTTKGERADDFVVRFALQPLQFDGGKIVQARRYQRIGPCPASWQAGDQGPPGGAPTSNLLSSARYGNR